jgi:hypothetical protein
MLTIGWYMAGQAFDLRLILCGLKTYHQNQKCRLFVANLSVKSFSTYETIKAYQIFHLTLDWKPSDIF